MTKNTITITVDNQKGEDTSVSIESTYNLKEDKILVAYVLGNGFVGLMNEVINMGKTLPNDKREALYKIIKGVKQEMMDGIDLNN